MKFLLYSCIFESGAVLKVLRPKVAGCPDVLFPRHLPVKIILLIIPILFMIGCNKEQPKAIKKEAQIIKPDTCNCYHEVRHQHVFPNDIEKRCKYQWKKYQDLIKSRQDSVEKICKIRGHITFKVYWNIEYPQSVIEVIDTKDSSYVIVSTGNGYYKYCNRCCKNITQPSRIIQIRTTWRRKK